MTDKIKKGKRQPFHETIVGMIRNATKQELELLATLIKATVIPKDHDTIIAVWKQRMKASGWDEQDLGVIADLLEQKKEAKKKAKSEKK